MSLIMYDDLAKRRESVAATTGGASAAARHLRRQADVPVVEADHPEPEIDPALHPVGRPGHELAAEPHHEQQRLAVCRAPRTRS